MEDVLTNSAVGGYVSADDGDACLVESAKRDPQHFGELYERYYVRVYRYVYHRVGGAPEAEDVTAQIFMKALEALPHYQSKRNSFAPWLFRIARNAVVDHYRRRKNQRPLDDIEREAVNADPLHHALGTEQREEMARLVEYLSAEQRDVVLMRFASDLSFSEIAAVMQKNEPAVRMLLHRGLRRLKAVMDDEHE